MPMLDVPGAELYYEVTGAGPVLLLITGAPGDATAFTDVVSALADRYTVVTYDWRGFTRSRLTTEPVDQHVNVAGDDAYQVLTAVTDESAFVAGTSAGALVGLELAIRHPDRVRALVAHEPPVPDILPDGEHWRRFYAEVMTTYRQDGPFAAIAKFVTIVGIDPGQQQPPEPGPQSDALMDQLRKNFDFFFGHLFLPFAHVPDLQALKAAGTPTVFAGGTESQGLMCRRSATRLADLYGVPLVEFPGDHQAMLARPAEFAAAVEAALTV
jgi:pimeloyl-ACP methyl ester carboxylesterase